MSRSESQKDMAARIMETYKLAWETRDADLVLTLLTEDSTYQESPFSEPMIGHAAIRKYWERATGSHQDVEFHWQDVGAAEGTQFVEWSCSFSRKHMSGRVELRGIMLIQLLGERILHFREYWVRRQSVPEPNEAPIT